MKVKTSPYERAINHLSRGNAFESKLADELERRVRDDMATDRNSAAQLDARIAAAREEQREADARSIESIVFLDSRSGCAAMVRATPLGATPLADENQALREALRSTLDAIEADDRDDAQYIADAALSVSLPTERDALRAELVAAKSRNVEFQTQRDDEQRGYESVTEDLRAPAKRTKR